MTDTSSDELRVFAEGSVIEQWNSARKMMASKVIISLASSPKLLTGFASLGDTARNTDGIDRLLAIDLIVRLSSLVKGLKPMAEVLLAESLGRPLPSMSLVTESKELPTEAKPAEIRENIAVALAYASGEWVTPYVITALAAEDKSQRCRLELARQLVSRDRSVDHWFAALAALPINNIIPAKGFVVTGANRLRDISSALSEIIRERRSGLKASRMFGVELARMCRVFVPITHRDALPPRLDVAAADVARMLDDVLSIRIDTVAEAESYAPLEVFHRWWSPLPYPSVLAESCRPLIEKLLGAISLRARCGQRSEGLSSRLAQAVGIGISVAPMLVEIADSETGLSPEIDDWLRGRLRQSTPTADALSIMLGSICVDDLVAAIAPMTLEAEEAERLIAGGASGQEPFVRIINQIRELSDRLCLSVSGKADDVVEFVSTAHRTVTGVLPREHRVRILRPMVIRQRADGSADIIERALVTDV